MRQELFAIIDQIVLNKAMGVLFDAITEKNKTFSTSLDPRFNICFREKLFEIVKIEENGEDQFGSFIVTDLGKEVMTAYIGANSLEDALTRYEAMRYREIPHWLRVPIGSTIYGIYTLGLGDKIDDACAMDNIGVPRYWKNLTRKNFDYVNTLHADLVANHCPLVDDGTGYFYDPENVVDLGMTFVNQSASLEEMMASLPPHLLSNQS